MVHICPRRVWAFIVLCLVAKSRAALSSISLDNSSVVAGGMVLVTAHLDAPAVSATQINISSSAPWLLPASAIMIEPGRSSGSVGVQTGSVNIQQPVGITASDGLHNFSGSVTLRPHALSFNPIVAENEFTGTNWDLTKPANGGQIQAYAGQWSIPRGGNIDLYVSTISKYYDVDVFRLGYYNAAGARLVYTARNLHGYSQGCWYGSMQLPSNSNAILHHIVTVTNRSGTFTEDTYPRDANWFKTYSFSLPAQLITGVYLIRLTETQTGSQWYVPIVVRDESSGAHLVFATPTYTDQVYNDWGGASGYKNLISGEHHSYEVSFNRPYADDNGAGNLRIWTYQFVRFLEEKGYNVSYTTSNDITEGSTNLLHYNGYITAGHDEYWSQAEYNDVIQAANNGVSLGFFGGNDLYRQVRELPDLSGHPNRFVACYRGAPDPATSQEGVLGVSLNSTDWLHLGYSSEKLIRTQWIGFYDTLQDFIPVNTNHWVYQGAGVADGVRLPYLLGYEADGVVNTAYLSYPLHKITVLAKSPYLVYTATATEWTESDALIDEYPRGNFVFNAATIVWPLALTNYFPAGVSTTWSPRPPVLSSVRQITVNVLNRMLSGPTVLP